MPRHPIRSLADLARTWASPETERPVYWRALIGRDRWALLLITNGEPGDPHPAPTHQPAPRLNPEWARRTGVDLDAEDLLYKRIGQYLRWHVQDDTEVDVARAASIATKAAVSALAELGVDVASLQRPEEAGQ